MKVRNYLIVRAALLALFIVTATLLAYFPAAQDALRRAFEAIATVIQVHKTAGFFVFVLFAACSAAIPLFSSIALVPAGVIAWGEPQTFVGLLVGWTIGAIGAYGAGRLWGRNFVGKLISFERLDYYHARVNERKSLWWVILFRFALPSEAPSYVLGVIRYGFTRFCVVTFLSELPFALVVIYGGGALLTGQYLLLAALVFVSALVVSGAFYLFHKSIHRARLR